MIPPQIMPAMRYLNLLSRDQTKLHQRLQPSLAMQLATAAMSRISHSVIKNLQLD